MAAYVDIEADGETDKLLGNVSGYGANSTVEQDSPDNKLGHQILSGSPDIKSGDGANGTAEQDSPDNKFGQQILNGSPDIRSGDGANGTAEQDSPDIKWVKKNILIPVKNSEPVSTDAFGKVKFQDAARSATAKFARVGVNTEASVIFELLTKVWKLEQPRLLISVTGGAKNFNLNSQLHDQFYSCLEKVAQTPGAWFITGGTNTGVMMHVGEVILGDTKACIGISTWGIVTNACGLIAKDDNFGRTFDYQVACSLLETGAFLDYNHTHHLLVDDGSVGDFRKEIPLRSRIEEYIMKKARGAAILMVVGGGLGTLDTVREALLKVKPLSVLVIVDSGGVADLLSYAYDKVKNIDAIYNDANHDESLLNKVVELLPELKSESKEKQKDCYKDVLKCMRKKDYVTMFDMSEKVGLDEAILKAILRGDGKLKLFKQLELTLLWDRADLAKDCITHRRTELQIKDLNSTMIMALAMNRIDFVKLFQNYGISIQTLLTPQVLEFLYGYCSKGAHSILKHIIKKDRLAASGEYENVMELLCSFEKYDSETISISLKEIESVVHDACSDIMRRETDKFIEGNTKKQKFKDPYNELFFFALLCSMPKMALYLWSLQERSLNKAFFGIVINNYLAKMAKKYYLPSDITDQVKNNKKEFKKLCTKLLDQCFKKDREKTEQLITSSSLELNYHNCLNLAVLTNHKKFISHNAVQTIMNEFWNGSIKYPDISRNQLAIGYTSHEQAGAKTNLVENNSTQFLKCNPVSCSSILSPFVKMRDFYLHTPVVKFMFYLFSYLVFLGFFTYVLMVKKDTTTLSTAEWILVLYIITLTIEEILQVKRDEASTRTKKFFNWLSSNWNILDGIALLIFYVGLALRFNQTTLDSARVLHAINVGMWVIRLLNVFYVNQILAPYVVMISKMFLDMISFLLILFVFLVAYGISAILILKPQEGGPKVVDVIFHPYFNIYGELFTDRDPSNDNTTRFGTPAKKSYSEPLAWLLLGFYLLIANVLLLNLLVAIFNNTYQKVQSKSEQTWKFERYKMIMEYANRPPLIPLLWYICKFIVYLNDYYHDRLQPPEMPLKKTLTEQQLNDVIEFEDECKLLLKRSKDKKGELN